MGLGPNDAAAQRARLLCHLRAGPVTTIEARRPPLDILMPAARVFELRALGFDIRTTLVNQATASGLNHRVAQYSLAPNTGATT